MVSIILVYENARIRRKFTSRWLTYSTVKDAMLCLPCFLFSLETSGASRKYQYSNEWSEDGASDWKRGLEKICDHGKSESHQICSEKLENLKHNLPIYEVIDKQRALASHRRNDKIIRNKKILSRVVELVEQFARQNISFREHREDSESLNRGNFIEFLHHKLGMIHYCMNTTFLELEMHST